MAMSAKPPSEDTTAWVSGESDKFRQNPSHLLDLVREPEGRPAAIVVDQFEELFTLCTDEEARLAFIGNLEYLVHAPGERSAVIVSMREDFATYVARLPELQRLFEAGQVRVGPLSAKELREAIEGPANQVGLKFESGIVDDLVNQVLGEPAALPLLQFALLRL